MISFLTDETVISQKIGVEINDPIRLFTLEDIGINKNRFINDLAPSFTTLSWDYYTVKQEQFQFLWSHFPSEQARLSQFFPDYYVGKKSLEEIDDLIEGLYPEKRNEFNCIRPYRRRSVSRFSLTYDRQSWYVEKVPAGSFSQDTDDYRSQARVFEETDEGITSHLEFKKLLICLGQIVKSIRSDISRVSITCHQVGLVAVPDRSADNSPEGIHQDGVDYIVSALVVERKGVIGGISNVYGPDKQTKYLTITLEPGLGIFQADSGSPLWHDVTPICIADPLTVPEGVRNIFGFDIKVE